MEQSILTSTKKILGLDCSYTAFDLDVMTHINMTMSLLNELGIGPSGGLYIEDDTTEWSYLDLNDNVLSLVKTYIFLKVRYLFDPPTTSFLLDAVKNQVLEMEYRLTNIRDYEASLS